MNIGETKNQFEIDIQTEKYEILEAKRLHLNVSCLKAEINNIIIELGYSYQTIIDFKIANTIFITKRIFSVSSQKHKGQTLKGFRGDYSEIIELDHRVFTYLLDEILKGNHFVLKDIKNFIRENNFKVIQVKPLFQGGILDYLATFEFIDHFDNNLTESIIKDIIIRKLRDYRRVQIDSVTVIKTERDTYKFIHEGKEYKNLSLLNRLDLLSVEKII